jgi:hypothetical protein
MDVVGMYLASTANTLTPTAMAIETVSSTASPRDGKRLRAAVARRRPRRGCIY